MNLLYSKTLLGSVTLIEYVDRAFIASFPAPDANNVVNPANITLTAGATWNRIEPIAGTGNAVINYKDSENGPFYEATVNGVYLPPTLDYANRLINLMNGRYVLRITDGEGQRMIVGSPERFLKFSFNQNVKQQRTEVQDVPFSFTV